MQSLTAELEQARALDVDDLADAIESIGFECTRCGACCTGHGGTDHTATVFPDEVRTLEDADASDSADPTPSSSDDSDRGPDDESDRDPPVDHDGDQSRDWRDVARPMPYGLTEGEDGLEGETFEWALQTDGCGDCVFYEEDDGGTGACVAHGDRPLICQTYPFSVVLANEASEGSSDESDGALAGTSQPMGEAVDEVGAVRAHECEGLGRDISREDAVELARTLKERAIRELEEAIDVRDAYEPATRDSGEVVVHDSEGAKRADGTPLEE